MSIKIPFLTPLYTMEHRPEQVVASIEAPILLVGAEHDSINPASETVSLFDAAVEPKELWIVPAAGHYDLYEEPLIDDVAARQIDFFNRNL